MTALAINDTVTYFGKPAQVVEVHDKRATPTAVIRYPDGVTTQAPISLIERVIEGFSGDVDSSTGEVTPDDGYSEIVVDVLTDTERQQLESYEVVIQNGLQQFVEVGNALLAIRDSRLYRQQHKTFEDYCQQRWGFTRKRAFQLMQASEVVARLSTIVDTPLPVNEGQVRALAKFDVQLQPAIMQTVAATSQTFGKPITAGMIERHGDIITQAATIGAVDVDGIPTPLTAAIEQSEYEAMQRQRVHMHEDTGRHKPKSNYQADEHTPDPRDQCQTPDYAIDPLLPFLRPEWTLWEPAAGEGLLVEALHDGGIRNVISSDVITGQNFFTFEPEQSWDVLVTNPPFSLKYRFLERCYALGKPFALLMPVETIGAQTAQNYFREHGVEVIFMDRRVNYKMPNLGWDGTGAQFPSAWFTWGLNIGTQMLFARINRDE